MFLVPLTNILKKRSKIIENNINMNYTKNISIIHAYSLNLDNREVLTFLE